MHQGRFSLSLVLSIAALVAGCGGAPTAPPDGAADATKAPAKSEAPAPTPEGEAAAEDPAEGEEAEPPAPSFAELKKAAMACPASEDDGSLDGCEAFTQWHDQEKAFENGKADPELLKMLASAEPKERRLAVGKLLQTLTEETLDAKKADAVLDAAEKERDENLAKELGRLVGGLLLVKVGKLDRAITIAKAHPVADFGQEFLFAAGSTNRDAKLVAHAIAASKDKSSSLRNAALYYLAEVAPTFPAEACPVVNGLRADKVPFVANRATDKLAGISKCGAFTDKLLDSLSAVDVKKNVDADLATAMAKLCKRGDLTPAQRSRGNKAARRVVDTPSAGVNARFHALAAIVACDPEGGKTYIEKFTKDPSSHIANQAADLIKRGY